ncbi:hypothetical protein QUB63_21495 [Microcoleus sp. ARI1-B5]
MVSAPVLVENFLSKPEVPSRSTLFYTKTTGCVAPQCKIRHHRIGM